MEGLEKSVKKATDAMSSLEKDKEAAIRSSRAILRLSKKSIHAIHSREDPSSSLDEMRATMDALLESCHDPAVLMCGPVQDCMCEYAEAAILHAAVSGAHIPGHEELRLTPSAWILGLCDCEGELRRMVTSCLMDGDMGSAKIAFQKMEEVHVQVMSFDVPDAIAPVRRKQDVARGVMDKTRSEMLYATISRRRTSN
jgi:translin